MSLFEIDLHPKKATINSCAGALFLDFVIARRLCPNITVRRGAHGGRSEQEATEGTEMGSILCFLCYLLLSLEAEACRSDDGCAFMFVCFSWVAVIFPAQWEGGLCLRGSRGRPDICGDVRA